MSHEVHVQRTIWVAECPHKKVIKTEPVRGEHWCPECKDWIPYKPQSWTGPNFGKEKA